MREFVEIEFSANESSAKVSHKFRQSQAISIVRACVPSAPSHCIEIDRIESETMVALDLSSVSSVTLDSEANLFVANDDNNLIVAGAGIDTVVGMGGNDYLFGNQDDDRLYGNDGDDAIYAGQGNDMVRGEAGDDEIVGDRDNDLLFGGSGNDSVSGGSENDEIYGNDDADLLYGNQGVDSIFGGDGNDTVMAGKDNDVVFGDFGNDLLYGDLGDDTLYSDVGSDTLYGGEGRDRFSLSPTTGGSALENADIIEDYNPNEDSLLLIGGLTLDRLNLEAGTDEYASDTIARDRQSGEYLAILKNIDSRTLELALGLDSSNSGSGGSSDPTDPSDPSDPSTGSGGSSDPTDPSDPSDPSTGSGGGSDPFSFFDTSNLRVGFIGSQYIVREDDGTVSLTLERSDAIAATTVDYRTSDGSARAGSDYTATSGSVTFNLGEVRKTVTIPISNDNDTEGDETFKVTLTNIDGGVLDSSDEVTVTIEDDDSVPTPSTGSLPAAIDTSFVGFSPSDSEATIAATSAQRLTIGTQTLYIGTHQASSINQNPIIASFDSSNPSNNWIRTDYEATGADGRGYGLFWNGSNLYAVFSTDGTQGTSSQDWRRASGSATQNWLKSYGAGGGAKVSVIGQIDLATGELQSAAYLSALLSSGNSNTLTITDVTTNGSGNLVVSARSFFNPRNPDGSAMTQVGSDSSPFDYTLEISPDLRTVVDTSAVGWV
ncbi:hypothetical protein AY599_00395 [Leptolyngbya valderiana BDU 20041]|nr:hypothetical protein AY599_00395 [Leptolyngbya valderiana BDU 20041]PPT08678.1 Alkaline phosphatase [Geitlerinema sp. FC II]